MQATNAQQAAARINFVKNTSGSLIVKIKKKTHAVRRSKTPCTCSHETRVYIHVYICIKLALNLLTKPVHLPVFIYIHICTAIALLSNKTF